jgi:Ni/Fe-hydrogenase 1 B-type cytochrome subunit
METGYREIAHDEVEYLVWDSVARVTHWIHALAFGVLLYTGFAIGGTVGRSAVDEPVFGFTMATTRNFHYIAAVVFTVNGLFRVYWFVFARQYRLWFLHDIWHLDFWREVVWKFKDYITLRYVDHEAHTLGHNALASLSYSLAFLVSAGLVITGFAMRGQNDPGGAMQFCFGWVIALFGGEANVRAIHRFLMWPLIAFVIHHVAIVFYLDVLGEGGLLSSIVGGFKFKPKDWRPVEKPWLRKR